MNLTKPCLKPSQLVPVIISSGKEFSDLMTEGRKLLAHAECNGSVGGVPHLTFCFQLCKMKTAPYRQMGFSYAQGGEGK